MIDWVVLTAAATSGLLGSAHCAAMCGGIATSFSAMRPDDALPSAVLVNLGRISGYTLAGFLVGLLGGGVLQVFRHEWLRTGSRVLLGVVLILTAWRLLGGSGKSGWLGKPGMVLWQKLQPLHRHLIPANSRPKVFALGILWGWLPCGLSLTMLTTAWLQVDPWMGALTMLVFGLSTLLVMLPISYAGSTLAGWTRHRGTRWMGAGLLFAAGLLTLAAPWLMRVPALHGILGSLGCLPPA